MSRMNKLSSYRTTIRGNDNGGLEVVYVSTPIVTLEGDTVTLNSGGWETVTTKRKMNQASNQFGLGFGVFQKEWVWFVDLPNGETVKFVDGMSFKRG
jgi:hypothetical protein